MRKEIKICSLLAVVLMSATLLSACGEITFPTLLVLDPAAKNTMIVSLPASIGGEKVTSNLAGYVNTTVSVNTNNLISPDGMPATVTVNSFIAAGSAIMLGEISSGTLCTLIPEGDQAGGIAYLRPLIDKTATFKITIPTETTSMIPTVQKLISPISLTLTIDATVKLNLADLIRLMFLGTGLNIHQVLNLTIPDNIPLIGGSAVLFDTTFKSTKTPVKDPMLDECQKAALCEKGVDPNTNCVTPCSQDSECDNGIFCNGVEHCCKEGENCLTGTCQPGTPPDCADTISCTTDICDETSKSCSHVANHTLCNENQLCDAQQGCRTVTPHDTPGRMLIIAAEPLRSIAEDYRRYRKATGFDVELSSTQEIKTANPAVSLVKAIKNRVTGFVNPGDDMQKLYLLLIGDAKYDEPENTDFIPVAQTITGDIGNSPYEGGGDSPYGDIDEDGVPDLSIGRIPFSNPLDVTRYLDRIWDYESNYSPGIWNKTINVFGGESGWGSYIDSIIESIAAEVFEHLSYDFDFTITYAHSQSAYYLPPTEWQKDYSKHYQEGAVLMPFIGHSLGSVACCDGDPPARRGLLAFFSCYDGAFQYTWSSLADDTLLRDQGPVATLGATYESASYSNAIFTSELAYAVLNLRTPTYGRAVQLAKYNVIYNTNSDLQTVRAMIDAWGLMQIQMDSSSGAGTLVEINMSNNLLYNLLGDPAVPMHLPQGSVAFTSSPDRLLKGTTVTIQGSVSKNKDSLPMESGELTVTLEVQRSVLLEQMISGCDYSNTQPCISNHNSANNKIVSKVTGSIDKGTFSVQLSVPATLPAAKYYLKAYAQNGSVDAVGSMAVTLQ